MYTNIYYYYFYAKNQFKRTEIKYWKVAKNIICAIYLQIKPIRSARYLLN